MISHIARQGKIRKHNMWPKRNWIQSMILITNTKVHITTISEISSSNPWKTQTADELISHNITSNIFTCREIWWYWLWNNALQDLTHNHPQERWVRGCRLWNIFLQKIQQLIFELCSYIKDVCSVDWTQKIHSQYYREDQKHKHLSLEVLIFLFLRWRISSSTSKLLVQILWKSTAWIELLQPSGPYGVRCYLTET